MASAASIAKFVRAMRASSSAAPHDVPRALELDAPRTLFADEPARNGGVRFGDRDEGLARRVRDGVACGDRCRLEFALLEQMKPHVLKRVETLRA
jgi:hypothetical protein